MPESRIDSASSFGVFWRSAPSTSAIMRSRKVEPDAAVTFTLIRSDTTVVPPVTAERSPPASRITGADSPVIAELVDHGDAVDHLAVGRNEIAGLDQHDVADLELVRRHVLIARRRRTPGAGIRLAMTSRAHAAQRRRLRLAAAFGHRLGEVGEQHREPQPGGDLAGEHGIAGLRSTARAGRAP